MKLRRYCSTDCSDGAIADRELERERSQWIEGPCAWCGERFTINQPHARYCTESCGKRAADARRGGRFRIAPRERAAIYERDGWRCQLCGDDVDPTLPASDAWAATLDHVVPQSLALLVGEPDHSAANLRLAHRWCNSLRGDGSTEAAGLLFAAAAPGGDPPTSRGGVLRD